MIHAHDIEYALTPIAIDVNLKSMKYVWETKCCTIADSDMRKKGKSECRHQLMTGNLEMFTKYENFSGYVRLSTRRVSNLCNIG